MRNHRLLALALAAALTLSATACGSSDSKAISKADFTKQADAICKKGDAEIDKLSDGVDGTDQKALEAFYVKAATASLEQISKVRDLGFPKGDEDRLDKDLSASEAAFEKVKADPSKTEELAADKDIKAASEDLKKYGLKECGQG
ncbi:hypothetical protein KSP35_02940 [Aquihabitans sp. G128]|uniref:hypothetical protein n=1 Tax=Aquihabitans sp. G128 TaxID=2849779 RepID=UPI001C2461A4|nr:hypothetical protein [Aquihabitans sp. G128]QXC61809.1 hypothetical protein KSP35_02940 [Aquihabitans sp. G128]